MLGLAAALTTATHTSTAQETVPVKTKSRRTRAILAALVVLLAPIVFCGCAAQSDNRRIISGTRNASAAAAANATARSFGGPQHLFGRACQAARHFQRRSGKPVCPVAVQQRPFAGDDGQVSASARKQIAALETEKTQRSRRRIELIPNCSMRVRWNVACRIAEGVPTPTGGPRQGRARPRSGGHQGRSHRGIALYIDARNGKVASSFPQYQRFAPASQLDGLEGLASRAEVRFIQPAARALLNNIDSQGDVTHQANIARSTFAVDGPA